MSYNALNQAAFATLLGVIGRSQTELTANIQTAAVNAIYHANVHGNVTCGQQLLDCLGKSMRKDALLKFLEAYGNFAWSKTDKKLLHFKSESSVDFSNDEAVAKLETTPWNEAKKQAELVSTYDVDAQFTKFIASVAAKAKQVAEAGGVVKNTKLLDLVRNTVGRFEDIKTLSETADMSFSDAAQRYEDHTEALIMNRVYDEQQAGVVIPPISIAA